MDFYIQAAKILVKLDAQSGSIKGLTLGSGLTDGPRLYALNGIVSNSGPFKDAVSRHKTRLKAEWIKTKIRLKVTDHKALAKTDSTFLPRWARINTLRIDQSSLLEAFSDFIRVETLTDLKRDCLYIDEHIDNLIAFHPDQSLTNHKHYLDGSLIFQNKASCIPSYVLDPPRGASVVDACAAPGNKTSHLAAIMGNTEVIHQDFTRTDIHDPKFAQVTHILLDPSCSGSGIVNRLDYLTNATVSENETSVQPQDSERLESLSSFQYAILIHAMKFPSAQKITYSTCSIHAIENERVVMEALRKAPDWTMCPRSAVLPSWPVRGLLEECGGNEEVADSLIRAVPGDRGTIGFFVACFERRGLRTLKREALFSKDDSDADEPETAVSDQSNVRRRKKNKKKKRKKMNGSAGLGDNVITT
ncbi:hypothetical protein MRB53_039144 [Persea americana]|nr:hypothetical protein MRB53_039144 [Persea americana]